jgi:hypothetical protein
LSYSALNGRAVTDTELFDLNRVEVLRGSLGRLCRAGSMDGTIGLATNPPKMGTYGLQPQFDRSAAHYWSAIHYQVLISIITRTSRPWSPSLKDDHNDDPHQVPRTRAFLNFVCICNGHAACGIDSCERQYTEFAARCIRL